MKLISITRVCLGLALVLGITLGGIALGGSALQEMRTWKSADGKYTVEAELVSSDGKKVLLKKEDGEEIEVEISKLSRTDQAFLKQGSETKSKSTEEPKEKPSASKKASSTKAKSSEEKESPVNENGPWPRWRGPNLDGISQEKGLLQEWPEEGPKLLWTAKGLGGGFGSVSVGKDAIYVMGRKQSIEYIHALSIEDGSIKWSAEVGQGRGEQGPNCTPTIDDGKVYGISFNGELLCADAMTGDAKWKVSFPDEFGGRMMSGWGYSESPLIDGDKLVCTPGGSRAMMAALNKESGKVIWSTPLPDGGQKGGDGAGYSSIVISNAGGVKQYVQLVGRGVIGVSADKGELLWGYPRIANGTANVPTPVIFGDFVFCSSGYDDGGTALLKLSKQGKGVTATEVYYKASNEMQNHHGGMIALGEYVFFGNKHNNGFPICVHMPTGRVAWDGGRGAGSGSAAITYADGNFYFRYENGTMALIEATTSKYNLKSSFDIPSSQGQHWAQPVIADGKLYLRDQDALLCYELKQ